MRSRRPFRLALAALTLAFLASGCYLAEVDAAIEAGDPFPWFCDPIAPNSVTGPGMGTVNYYAGQTRAPLGQQACRQLAIQMDAAKKYAVQYPTAGSAEAAGFRPSFAFIPGMGTHHGRETFTPAMLNDPSFNRHDPILPGVSAEVFDSSKPPFLQYNGNGPDAKLVGMSWYVRTTTGLPPEGFPGANDWWHHHPRLCMRKTDSLVIQVNSTDSACTSAGGVNLNMERYYMAHMWLVDDLEYEADVFAPQHPCIKSNGAIFDMSNPCHTSALPAGRSSRSSAPVAPAAVFCPIGTLAPEASDPAAGP